MKIFHFLAFVRNINVLNNFSSTSLDKKLKISVFVEMNLNFLQLENRHAICQDVGVTKFVEAETGSESA